MTKTKIKREPSGSVADITHIKDLKPDKRNARKHNPRNIGMIEDALNEVGAARSIVIDEDGNILAGNGTVEAAAQAGIERVKVVEADGEEIVAVRRRGLTEKQKRRLALFDNRTAELAEWETDVVREIVAEDAEALKGMFVEQELERLLDEFGVSVVGSPELPNGDRAPFRQMTFTVHDEQFEEVEAAIKKAKSDGGGESSLNENSNGNALAWICGKFNRG